MHRPINNAGKGALFQRPLNFFFRHWKSWVSSGKLVLWRERYFSFIFMRNTQENREQQQNKTENEYLVRQNLFQDYVLHTIYFHYNLSNFDMFYQCSLVNFWLVFHEILILNQKQPTISIRSVIQTHKYWGKINSLTYILTSKFICYLPLRKVNLC